MAEKHTRLIKDPDRHAPYQDEVNRQLDRIEKSINEYNFDPNDRPTLAIAMWMMKSWEIGDSMIALSKTRSEHSLFILLRSLVEYCARAKYVSLEPKDREARFIRSEAKDELGKNKDDPKYTNLLQAVLEKLGPGKGVPDFRGMLEAIGHEPLYFEYQKLSKFTHGSIHKLYESAMEKKQESQNLVMLQEPTDDEKYLLWYVAAYFLNMGAEAIESRNVGIEKT